MLAPLALPQGVFETTPDTMTVLIAGGEAAVRDRFARHVLDDGGAVCCLSHVSLVAESVAAFATSACLSFDVVIALCADDDGLTWIDEASLRAEEVVLIRDRPWTDAEGALAAELGNVILLPPDTDADQRLAS